MSATQERPDRSPRAVHASANRLTLLVDVMEAGLPELSRLSDAERQALGQVMVAMQTAAVAVMRHKSILEAARDREREEAKRLFGVTT